MAEILVRAVNGTCPDPAANSLRGMPIVVMPDGHVWGAGERLPEYVIIQLPAVLVSTVQQYTARWETITGDVVTLLGRRRYLVPEVIVKAAESAGGTYTRTRNQFTRALIDRAA